MNKKKYDGSGFFFVIALIFLGISVWQTGLGYQLMFGEILAWLFSFCLGITMFYLLIQMRRNRINGVSAIGPLIAYLVVAIFSFLGNFNALYTRFNEDELYKKELLDKKEDLVGSVVMAKNELSKVDPESIFLITSVNSLKKQLKMQILDPANPGIGIRSKIIINDLEDKLGQKLTEFSGTPEQLAAKYVENIENILDIKLNVAELMRSRELIDDITDKHDDALVDIDNALTDNVDALKARKAIQEGVNSINEIGSKTKNFVGHQYEYEKAIFVNQEVGKLSFSIKSALSGDNNFSAIITFFVAIAIDGLIPLVVFLSTIQENPRYRDNYEGEVPDIGKKYDI